MPKPKLHILYSGGGTLGSVTPLLAVHDVLNKKYEPYSAVWVGTKHGPERAVVEETGLRYVPMISGKFRRYASLKNVIDLFRIGAACVQALILLGKERPDICITAGGYVSVPLHLAARIKRIPTWVHQQDVVVGLANVIMAKHAHVVTTALKQTVKKFPGKQAKWIGNPVREQMLYGDAEKAKKAFGLTGERPVVLVLGGGTGAAQVNDLIIDALPELDGHCEVVHVYGPERQRTRIQSTDRDYTWYHPFPFLGLDLRHAYAAADVVVSRAGFGTLSELAALKKPVILIPKPGHQDDNAAALLQTDAAIVLSGEHAHGEALARNVLALLASTERKRQLGEHIHASIPRPKAEQIIRIVRTLLQGV